MDYFYDYTEPTSKKDVVKKLDDKPTSFRNWFGIIYQDTESYNFNEVISIIRSCKEYAFIKHTPEQEEKKEHYHVFIRFQNAKTESALKKYLGLPENYFLFKPVKNVRSAVRYLTHIDYPEKIQYSVDDVVVSRSFQRKFLLNYEDIKTEEQIINDIYNFIDNLALESYRNRLKFLTLFINNNVYDTVFKRYKSEFMYYLNNLE